MSAEPTQRIIPIGVHVQCTDGYGGSVTRRDTQVMASDGPAGHLTAFFVDRASGGINSIVVRLGHWLTKHEQTIPIAAVERIDSGTLYLALTRDQIATLPVMPMRRRCD